MSLIRSNWKNGILNFWHSGQNSTFKTGVWSDCPFLAMTDPTVAYTFFEDFMNWKGVAIATTAMAGWTVSQAGGQGAVTTDDTVPGGVLLLDSDSTTVTQGAQIQYAEGTLPFIPAADKDLWFECKLKVVDTFDKCEFFAGLAAVDTSIIAASANSSPNHIGWQCVTDDGVLLFSAEKATAGATKASTTLEEATYIRLGFKVNGVTSVEHWVDGVKIATTQVTANIPIVGMTPSFVCQSGGTNAPIVHLDWVKIVQLR